MNDAQQTLPKLAVSLPEPNTCKGVVFRADVQHCKTKRGVLFSVRLNKQVRMSCPGCAKCGWLDDYMSEIGVEWPIIGIESAQPGAYYTIDICNESRDWEFGCIDEWDLKLVPYEVKK